MEDNLRKKEYSFKTLFFWFILFLLGVIILFLAQGIISNKATRLLYVLPYIFLYAILFVIPYSYFFEPWNKKNVGEFARHYFMFMNMPYFIFGNLAYSIAVILLGLQIEKASLFDLVLNITLFSIAISWTTAMILKVFAKQSHEINNSLVTRSGWNAFLRFPVFLKIEILHVYFFLFHLSFFKILLPDYFSDSSKYKFIQEFSSNFFIIVASIYFFKLLVVLISSFYNDVYLGLRKIEAKNIKKIKSLSIKNINNTFKDLNERPIIFLKSQADYPSYCFFQLDLNDFFPKGAEERVISVENSTGLMKLEGMEVDNIDSCDKFFLALDINFNQRINAFDFKVQISYKDKSKKLKYRRDFYHILLTFTTDNGVLVVNDKFLCDYKLSINYRKVFRTDKNKRDTKLEFSTILNSELKRYVLPTCLNSYCYNDMTDLLNLEEVIMDNRKVIAHEKKYGVGKTTYDILSISKQNFIPITISAWEANYDHDVLYLIFDTIKKTTGTKSFKNPPRILWGVFLLAILPLASLIKGFFDSPIIVAPAKSYEYLIEYRNKFLLEYTDDSLFKYTNGLFEDNYKLLAFIFIVVIFSLWICFRHTPDFLIFKKDNTQVYKDFYVDNIINMLRNNPNHILLIEDIDRLEPRVINEVFRILSSINSRLPKSFRRFAIISYSRKIVTEKLDKIGITYNEVTNKVIASSDWGKNYNAKESMKIYNELNFRMTANYLNLSPSSDLKEIIEKASKQIDKLSSNFNFRNLYSVWTEMYDKLDRCAPIYMSEQAFEEFRGDLSTAREKLNQSLRNQKLPIKNLEEDIESLKEQTDTIVNEVESSVENKVREEESKIVISSLDDLLEKLTEILQDENEEVLRNSPIIPKSGGFRPSRTFKKMRGKSPKVIQTF